MTAAMTDRFRQCVDAGNAMALFSLLKDWPESELRALLADVDAYYAAVEREINEEYEKAFASPRVVFNPALSRVLDAGTKKARDILLAVCSEISSVALHYLPTEHAEAK